MTVGDLRELDDQDWQSLGLTVFACRALRNALNGRPHRRDPTQPGSGPPSGLPPSSQRNSSGSTGVPSGPGSPKQSTFDSIIPTLNEERPALETSPPPTGKEESQ